MSITARQEPAVKRRKLSHSSINQSLVKPTIPDANARIGTEDGKTSSQHGNSRSQGKGATGAGPLTKSALMTLQIDELLNGQKRPDIVQSSKLKSTVKKIIEAIKTYPERTALALPQAEKWARKHGIAIPFGRYRPAADIKYSFTYLKPRTVRLRGNLVQQLCTTGEEMIEIIVEMPPSLFSEKDYLNYRAFHKRAYYIACLTSIIKEQLQDEVSYRFEFYDANELVPIISLQELTNSSSSQDTRIVINTTFPPGLGPLDKTLPIRNCIRTDADASNSSHTHPPTPFYNSTIRAVASVSTVDTLLENAVNQCEAFNDASILGQIWLRQRGCDGASDKSGFGGIEWSLICASLLTAGGHQGKPLFSSKYSSVQLFKAMLQVLSGRDLIEQPMSTDGSNMRTLGQDIPIFYHAVSGINVLYKMKPWSYQALKHQAQISLTAANARNVDSFDTLFITRVADIAIQYDEFYLLDISATLLMGSERDELLFKIYTTLKQGLGDRVTLLELQYPRVSSWGTKEQRPIQSSSAVVKLGLMTNSEVALRTIDHGPTAEEQEEAKAFRSFWGPKSELRRFKDGRITETLVWSSTMPITHQIIQYLMLYHFKIAPSALASGVRNLDPNTSSSDALLSFMEAYKLINTKYQDLSSKMHQLEGMPLPIRSVSPVDSALRSATLAHPLEFAMAKPIDVLVQFDSSARWPDHLPAIQHTKVAFLAKLADLLSGSDSSLTARIGLENTVHSNTGFYNTSFLDIIYPSSAAGHSPIVFRVRVHHDREQHLLQAASSSTSSQTREILTVALADHKRDFIASPSHTAAIRNLITHFSPLSTTIRSLKSWIAHHNLSNHIPAPILEIIASHIFLHPAPWSTPNSSTTAFLRCLHFLSRWDWASTPLITDLSLGQEMSVQAYQDLETRFQAWRKLDPSMNTVTWFVGTNIDSTGTVWTQGAKPARVVAGRVTSLAKAAIELVRAKDSDMDEADWKSLFVSSLQDFDFVLYLKKDFVTRRAPGDSGRKNGGSKFKNLQVQDDMDVDRIGHDVVGLYLADLEKVFGNSALFFHGEGGPVVAGLWKPSTIGSKEWRVRLGWSSVPVSAADGEEVKCVVNKDGMLAEMAMLGEGLVDKITTKPQ